MGRLSSKEIFVTNGRRIKTFFETILFRSGLPFVCQFILAPELEKTTFESETSVQTDRSDYQSRLKRHIEERIPEVFKDKEVEELTRVISREATLIRKSDEANEEMRLCARKQARMNQRYSELQEMARMNPDKELEAQMDDLRASICGEGFSTLLFNGWAAMSSEKRQESQKRLEEAKRKLLEKYPGFFQDMLFGPGKNPESCAEKFYQERKKALTCQCGYLYEKHEVQSRDPDFLREGETETGEWMKKFRQVSVEIVNAEKTLVSTGEALNKMTGELREVRETHKNLCGIED